MMRLLQTGGGPSGWKPGLRVKVFLMDLDKERLRYGVLAGATSFRGTMPNKVFKLGENGALTYVANGSTVSLNQIFVRASASRKVTFDELLEGEIGISLSSEPLNKSPSIPIGNRKREIGSKLAT